MTLTGVGGVGKTRLALELAARSPPTFPDGVFVIELAAVGDPAAVPEAVAAVLGITQQPGLSVAESVAAALEGRSRLLVFDNCEHVLDAAADMIEAILSRSATVKILATSREGLRLADEQLWPVPSLVNTRRRLGGGDIVRGTRAGGRADHVTVEIRRRPRGGGDLPPPGRDSVGNRVGRIPPAVDDSHRGARSARRSVPAAGRIAARSGATPNVAPCGAVVLRPARRHDEKCLLARCSVFAGGFDLAGACAVTGSADEFATLDLLDALTRKSLLVADRSSAHARFSMLETIRQFAEEQLVDRVRR